MGDINIEDIEPNSQKYKAEKKERAKPIVDKNKIVSTRKSVWRRFMESFLDCDVPNIKAWLIHDVLIPTAQDTILDTIQMIFYNDIDRGRGRSSRRDRRDRGRTNYSSYYRGGSSSSRRRSRRDDRDDYYDHDEKIDYRNIVLRDRVDAENVVDDMRARIRNNDSVSVADLLDLVGLPGRYTDNNWGWDREDDIGIKRISSGFLIDVTEARYLD